MSKAELISSLLLRSCVAVEVVATFLLELKTILQTAHLLFYPSRDRGHVMLVLTYL